MIEFDKTLNLDAVKKQFMDRAAMRYPKMRQILVKFLGNYYWKTMNNKDFTQIYDSLFSIINYDLRTDEDKARFIAKEQMIRDPLELPQWRVFIHNNT